MSNSHKGSLEILKNVVLPVDSCTFLGHFDITENDVLTGISPISNVTTMLQYEGKFGGGIAVEEGTTNLLSNTNGRPFAMTAGGTSLPTCTIVQDSTNPFGTESYQITFTGNSATGYTGCRATSNTWSLVSGNFYSATCWIKGDMSKITAYHTGQQGMLHLSPTGKNVGSWVEYGKNNDKAVYNGTNYLTLYLSSSTTSDISVNVVANQLEQKSFATSYVNGTRNNGILTYPKEILSTGAFTINMWINVKNLTIGTYNSFFEVTGGDSGGYNRLLWMLEIDGAPYNKLLSLWGGNDSSTFYNRSSFSPVVGKWHMITLTFDGSTYIQYADGVEEGRTSGVAFAPKNTAIASLGGNSFAKANAIFDEVRIDSVARTPEEIMSWYICGAPFYPKGIYTIAY